MTGREGMDNKKEEKKKCVADERRETETKRGNNVATPSCAKYDNHGSV